VGGRSRKQKGKMAIKYKGKGKLVLGTNSPKINVSANSDCYFSNSKGHWKRNCLKYLGDMKFENVSKVSVSSIYVIEINIATSLDDWVLGTGSCAHICTNMYALRNKRKLRNKGVQLRVVFTKRAYIGIRKYLFLAFLEIEIDKPMFKINNKRTQNVS
jgi:hypothetical protein